MNLWLFAAKNLTYRKVRTGLTILSIAVAVAVFYSLASFFNGYEGVVRQQYQELGAHLIVTPIGCPYEVATLVQRGGKIPRYLPEQKILGFLQQQPEVRLAAPALIHAIVRPEEGRTDIYLGIDERTLTLRTHWKLVRVQSRTGGALKFEETDERPTPELLASKNAALLGYDAALIEQREPGDRIWVPEIEKEFKVTGVLAATGTQDDGLFYIPFRTAQKYFGKEGKLTFVMVQLNDPFTADEVARRIKKEVPDADVITYAELQGTLLRLMNSAKALIFAVVIVVLAISALGLMNTVLMSVHERVREIGVMRATGAAKLNVFSLIWTETLVMTLVGVVAGLALAMALGRGVIESVLKSYFNLSSEAALIRFEPRLVALTMLLILAIGTIAGFLPALRAARANPIQALRQE